MEKSDDTHAFLGIAVPRVDVDGAVENGNGGGVEDATDETAADEIVIAGDVSDDERKKLPAIGHAIAGTFAGWTVSFIAAPVEHVKARLQVQYQATKSQRLY